jgi:hypothetical protein
LNRATSSQILSQQSAARHARRAPDDLDRTAQGKTFQYYATQQEAMETLIYFFEVKKIRRSRALATGDQQ